MQIIKLLAWAALSCAAGFYLNGQGQPCVVSAAKGFKMQLRDRMEQKIGNSFCHSNDTAEIDGGLKQVMLRHPK
jgi:hypothetical protein